MDDSTAWGEETRRTADSHPDEWQNARELTANKTSDAEGEWSTERPPFSSAKAVAANQPLEPLSRISFYTPEEGLSAVPSLGSAELFQDALVHPVEKQSSDARIPETLASYFDKVLDNFPGESALNLPSEISSPSAQLPSTIPDFGLDGSSAELELEERKILERDTADPGGFIRRSVLATPLDQLTNLSPRGRIWLRSCGERLQAMRSFRSLKLVTPGVFLPLPALISRKLDESAATSGMLQDVREALVLLVAHLLLLMSTALSATVGNSTGVLTKELPPSFSRCRQLVEWQIIFLQALTPALLPLGNRRVDEAMQAFLGLREQIDMMYRTKSVFTLHSTLSINPQIRKKTLVKLVEASPHASECQTEWHEKKQMIETVIATKTIPLAEPNRPTETSTFPIQNTAKSLPMISPKQSLLTLRSRFSSHGMWEGVAMRRDRQDSDVSFIGMNAMFKEYGRSVKSSSSSVSSCSSGEESPDRDEPPAFFLQKKLQTRKSAASCDAKAAANESPCYVTPNVRNASSTDVKSTSRVSSEAKPLVEKHSLSLASPGEPLDLLTGFPPSSDSSQPCETAYGKEVRTLPDANEAIMSIVLPPVSVKLILFRDIMYFVYFSGISRHSPADLDQFLKVLASSLDVSLDLYLLLREDLECWMARYVARSIENLAERKAPSESSKAKSMRLLKMAGVGVGVGVVTALTAGFAAPAIAAGLGVAGAAFGVGSTTAVTATTTFLSTTAGAAAFAGLLGTGSAGFTSWKYGKRIGRLKVFRFIPIQRERLFSSDRTWFSPLESMVVETVQEYVVQVETERDALFRVRRLRNSGSQEENDSDKEGRRSIKSEPPGNWRPALRDDSMRNSSDKPSGRGAASGELSTNDARVDVSPGIELSHNVSFIEENESTRLLGSSSSSELRSEPEAPKEDCSLTVIICISGWLRKNKRRPAGTAPQEEETAASQKSSIYAGEDDVQCQAMEPSEQAQTDDNMKQQKKKKKSFPNMGVWKKKKQKETNPDIVNPWTTFGQSGAAVFAVQWDPHLLESLGDSLLDISQEFAMSITRFWLNMTVVAPLTTALAWPIGIISYAHGLDNIWATTKQRAEQAAHALAAAIRDVAKGRVVTLIGFSMGARVIFYALQLLQKQEIYGIVGDVVLAGLPTGHNVAKWESARTVVSGRFINAYSKRDWLLAFLCRYHEWSLKVAGISAVCVSAVNVENIDVSDIIHGHDDYCDKMPAVMRACGITVSSMDFPGA